MWFDPKATSLQDIQTSVQCPVCRAKMVALHPGQTKPYDEWPRIRFDCDCQYEWNETKRCWSLARPCEEAQAKALRYVDEVEAG